MKVLPNHATPERLDHLAAIGVTAVSIGAQSFHEGVLHHLGRPHDAATARAAGQAAVGRFACVDVDLIVDVALETPGPAQVAAFSAFPEDVRTCLAPRAWSRSPPTPRALRVHPFGSFEFDRSHGR